MKTKFTVYDRGKAAHLLKGGMFILAFLILFWAANSNAEPQKEPAQKEPVEAVEEVSKEKRASTGEYLLEDVSPDEAINYVKAHCSEYHEIPPDVVIFKNTRIILDSPMLVGFHKEKNTILVPFTKRCMGTFLVKVDATEEDFEFFRNWSEEKQSTD